MSKLFTCVGAVCLSLAAAAKTFFDISSDRSDCRYGVGETATFTVTATDGKGVPLKSGKVAWSLDNFGTDVVSPRAEVDLAAGNPFRVTGSLPYPGFLRLCLKAAGGSSRVWSVMVAPERVRAASPRPADFDAFWDGAVAKLAREVPLDPRADVAAGRRFEDAVTESRFGIDIHGLDKKANDEKAAGQDFGAKFRPFQIPLRACRARDVDNLYMAGRCISGDFIAHASYRVTGSSVAQGEAVGRAAAGAL